ncbi:MAG: polysaccharide biosynthesis C-terminal domain-containing protein [Saprospiraceae bacterium]|nr:polysaccharide biosynthesis C-terminal domain-containing protein [Saprospiraceae bacterium]
MRFSFSRTLDTTMALQLFQVMRLGSAVFSGIMLAKSGLPTATIGTWETLLYLATTFSFFWVNGLMQGIPAVYAKLAEQEKKALIFNSFLVFCAIACLVYLILLLGENWVVPALTALEKVPYFQWFALYLLLHLPTFPVESYYLVKQKPRAIIYWGCFSFGMHLVALGAPLWAGWGLEGSIQGLVIFSAVKFLWAFAVVIRFGDFRLDLSIIVTFIMFCIPLMMTHVVSNLMLLFDNWLVGWHFKDASVFAIYRYGAREFPLATALVSALGASLVPLLAVDLNTGLETLKRKTRRLMHLLFPLTILLLLISEDLFRYVFNTELAGGAFLFNIYLLTLPSRMLLPASIVLSKGDSRSIFVVSIFEMCIKMMLGFLFIRWWGLPGLAWSVVLAFWVEKLGLIVVLKRKYGIAAREWIDWKWYVAYVALLTSVFLVRAFVLS